MHKICNKPIQTDIHFNIPICKCIILSFLLKLPLTYFNAGFYIIKGSVFQRSFIVKEQATSPLNTLICLVTKVLSLALACMLAPPLPWRWTSAGKGGMEIFISSRAASHLRGSPATASMIYRAWNCRDSREEGTWHSSLWWRIFFAISFLFLTFPSGSVHVIFLPKVLIHLLSF